jgi:hypothetical protein
VRLLIDSNTQQASSATAQNRLARGHEPALSSAGAEDHRDMPKSDALDEQMHLLLGIAVAWCQQLETALVHLLDAHQHDTARPLEERWATVSK